MDLSLAVPPPGPALGSGQYAELSDRMSALEEGGGAEFASAEQGDKADTAVQPADLAPYATDADLAGYATTAQVNGKVAKGETQLNVRDYGAKGDNTGDDAPAITAAIAAATAAGGAPVYLPRGVYRTLSTITLPTNVTLHGAGPGSVISGGPGGHATLTLSGTGQAVTDLSVNASAGHAVEVANAYGFTFDRFSITQVATDKSAIYHNGSGWFIDAQFLNGVISTADGASVPAIYAENSANSLAATRWHNLRWNGTATRTAPFCRFVNTGVSNWTHDHSFRDITAELCRAGVIHMESAFGVIISGVVPWDVTTYTDDVFKFTTNATAATTCRCVEIRSSGRRGGSMTAGKYDVNATATTHLIVENCRPSVGAIVLAMPTGANQAWNANNGTGATFALTDGSSLKIPATATGSRPAAATVGAGGFMFDTTLNKPIWSDGTSWRDAAGTVV